MGSGAPSPLSTADSFVDRSPSSVSSNSVFRRFSAAYRSLSSSCRGTPASAGPVMGNGVSGADARPLLSTVMVTSDGSTLPSAVSGSGSAATASLRGLPSVLITATSRGLPASCKVCTWTSVFCRNSKTKIERTLVDKESAGTTSIHREMGLYRSQMATMLAPRSVG